MATTAPYQSDRLEIGRVFSMTFAVIARNALLFFGAGLVVSGIPAVLFQYYLASSMTAIGGSTSPDQILMIYSHFGLFFLPYWVFTVAVGTLLHAGIARAAIEDLGGRRPGLRDCFFSAVGVLLPAIGVALLIGIGSALGMLLLVVPGVILWLGWSVAIPVLVGERGGVFESMRRSRTLTRGSRWAIFALFLILVLVVWIVQIVVGLVGGLTVAFAGAYLGTALASGVASGLSTVLMTTAAATLYVELRRVKDGTGIDELARIFA